MDDAFELSRAKQEDRPAGPERHSAWIALGSNISPERFLPEAVRELRSLGTVFKTSSVWQSAPVGDIHQADFCNAAVLMMTSYSPVQLKMELRIIEARLGRQRDPLNKNAARTIDLDVVLYDDCVLKTAEIVIPDPELTARPFLATPLAELTPDLPHPEMGETLEAIARRIGGTDSLQQRLDIVLTHP